MSDSSWMSKISGDYVTQTTVLSAAAPGWHLCLPRNPRRFYVRFDFLNTPGTLIWVMPDPIQNQPVPGGGTNLPIEWKFKDCPSIVTGDFYSFVGGGFAFCMTECIYVGG